MGGTVRVEVAGTLRVEVACLALGPLSISQLILILSPLLCSLKLSCAQRSDTQRSGQEGKGLEEG